MDKNELFFAVADVSDVDDFLLWISIFSDVVFTGDKPFSFLDTFDDMAKNQSGQTFAPFLIVTWYCFGFHIIVRMLTEQFHYCTNKSQETTLMNVFYFTSFDIQALD